ncbi:MAG: hypothetical protein HC767_05020 [Akkermansiaceae bacterium]|nr:hypothetical protein [Akkermansiaceae bacterium]
MIKKVPILLLSGFSPLFAQDFLDPIYVTATRSQENESSSPYTSSYLDQNYLRENTHRTLPDAFQFTPGVLVQKPLLVTVRHSFADFRDARISSL